LFFLDVVWYVIKKIKKKKSLLLSKQINIAEMLQLIAWWGWESVFYATGIIGTVWFIAWWFLVFDSPREHPRITVKEQAYIERCLGGQIEHTRVRLQAA
jgi:MFS family permease